MPGYDIDLLVPLIIVGSVWFLATFAAGVIVVVLGVRPSTSGAVHLAAFLVAPIVALLITLGVVETLP